MGPFFSCPLNTRMSKSEFIKKPNEVIEYTYEQAIEMEPVVSTPSPTDDAKVFIAELAAWAETAHSCVPAGDTFLNNLVDEMQALIYRAKYKLENLA